MIRVVPTGDIGFDVVLGGGWCLVERLPGKESATILLRGGPGTGKTLLSVDIALALAGALGGDVVVGCVELLPSEYRAQIEGGRSELALQYRNGPPLAMPRVVQLPCSAPIQPTEEPLIFFGLLPDLESGSPDLVNALEALRAEVVALKGKPIVFVVDSLIDGYGLGPATPRQNIDALTKFAAQEGVGLVLCAETMNAEPAAWDFAVDTVVMLGQGGGKRTIQVQKHRFGASATGSHEFRIDGWTQPAIYPRPDTWSGIRRIRSTLETYGWRFDNAARQPRLRWCEELAKATAAADGYAASFAIVAGPDVELARKLAFGLFNAETSDGNDLLILLDARSSLPDGWSSNQRETHIFPISPGADAAICHLTEYLGSRLFPKAGGTPPRRIIIGDLALIPAPDAAQWVECIAVIANLVAASGCGVPVITYEGGSFAANEVPLGALQADLIVKLDSGLSRVVIVSRTEGTVGVVRWPNEVLARLDGGGPQFVPPSRHLF